MGNWSLTPYDSIADAKTAIDALDSTAVTIHVFGFKDGAKQKIVVVKST